MSLDVGTALSNGIERTFKRNGLVLIGVFIAFGVVDTVVSQSFAQAQFQQFFDPGQFPGATPPGDLPGLGGFFSQQNPLGFLSALPVAVLGLLSLLAAVIAEALHIVGVRTLVSGETETIPDEYVRRNIVSATLNGVIGGVVVAVLVGIGLILLIVPGIFLAIAFFFYRQEIAVQDKNFIDALSDSWALTKGNRLELFGLAVLLLFIGIVANAIGGVFGVAGPVVGGIAGVVINGGVVVFGMAVAARAYDQLASERAAQSADDGVEPVDDGEFDFA